MSVVEAIETIANTLLRVARDLSVDMHSTLADRVDASIEAAQLIADIEKIKAERCPQGWFAWMDRGRWKIRQSVRFEAGQASLSWVQWQGGNSFMNEAGAWVAADSWYKTNVEAK